MLIAVYPGTFDPLTRGHEDLIRRAARLCGRLIIGISGSRASTMFTLDERIAMAREAVAPLGNVEVQPFAGLLVDFATRCSATMVVRGVRSMTDFDYEFQMAGMNHHMAPDVETVFLTPTDAFQSISGTLVREIARCGGDVTRFVSPAINRRLVDKVAGQAAGSAAGKAS